MFVCFLNILFMHRGFCLGKPLKRSSEASQHMEYSSKKLKIGKNAVYGENTFDHIHVAFEDVARFNSLHSTVKRLPTTGK